ncbi:protein of unknown function [Candidatus Filomicrobium marinum]|uniref:Uncharacterized protein n=1 Tax=Candidatus Filomicrobium marinum TaxID=1608628 RepID=A0A0D6JGP2_9HYPH|nr:protein of unknown function [Candidatus Filomicrobium marinum]CPR20338.1 protein of unknown function [Candidatus Filomicrobium marinum]
MRLLRQLHSGAQRYLPEVQHMRRNQRLLVRLAQYTTNTQVSPHGVHSPRESLYTGIPEGTG